MARRISFSHILALRLINALTIATFFQPDEFFQSLEPAWRLAFGPDSGAWLTWEWHFQLRSSLHPMLFAIPYMAIDKASTLLDISAPLRTSLLVAAPATLQAVIAALGDWYTYKLASTIYGADSLVSYVALLMQLASPWQWFCSTRTFSNSLETTLTVAALSHWPWHLLSPPSSSTNAKPRPRINHIKLCTSLTLAALAVVLRPTNALIWLPVVGVTLYRCLRVYPLTIASPAAILLREGMLCGDIVLALSVVADRVYFGFWTFPPYNWLNFNISKSLAVFYGRNPWHYYLLQGLPLLCTTSLLFVLQALYAPKTTSANQLIPLRTLAATVYVTVLALSVISHKEVRFIYPLLPTLNVLAAPYTTAFFSFSSSPSPPSKSKTKSKPAALRNKPYLIAALAINALLAGYLSYFHQSAPLSVLSFLRTDYLRTHDNPSSNDASELFALFLMPCHSTPWRSHLVHPALHAYALSCEPPLHTAPGTRAREEYRDEADRFYDDPVEFLAGEMFGEYAYAEFVAGAVVRPSLLNLPRYIVGFEGVEEAVQTFIRESDTGRASGMKLKRVWSANNGLFHEDWRRAGKIVVWDTGVYGDALPEEKI